MRTINIAFQSMDEIVEFVRVVENYEEDMDLKVGNHIVDAKSLLGVMHLGTNKQLNLEVMADNCDALEERLEFCSCN